ncbi:MAG: hypothetical protein ACJASV_001224 [Pseudorhodobacter sp.]|jgi:hypothetical protein
MHRLPGNGCWFKIALKVMFVEPEGRNWVLRNDVQPAPI